MLPVRGDNGHTEMAGNRGRPAPAEQSETLDEDIIAIVFFA